MNIQHLFLLLASASLLLSACNGASQPEETTQDEPPAALEEQRWDEMMAIHDEVMPEMSTLNRIGRQLRTYAEESQDLTAAESERIEAAVQALETAEEGMWSWMNELQQLERLRREKDHAAIMDYLDGERERISRVRDEMQAAIEQGQALTRELGIGEDE